MKHKLSLLDSSCPLGLDLEGSEDRQSLWIALLGPACSALCEACCKVERSGKEATGPHLARVLWKFSLLETPSIQTVDGTKEDVSEQGQACKVRDLHR